MTAIARLVVRQRAAVILLAVILLVAGVFTAARMQLELFPNINLGTVTVVTAYPGASPDAVLSTVTKPVEAAVAGVPGIDTLSSTSSDNASFVVARFGFGTDLNTAESKVSAAVNALPLPTGVQHPTVSTLDFSSFPILYLVARSTDPHQSLEATYAQVKGDIAPQIQQVPGVAAADVGGGVTPQVLIRLHPALLARYGITPDAVAQTLQANNVQVPAGTITSSGVTQPVIAAGALTTLDEIRDLPVVPGGAFGGVTGRGPITGALRIVRLRDVADVTQSHSAYNTLGTTPGEIAGIVRYNGHPAISITIRKNSNANIVQVADGVSAKIRELQKQYPNLKIGTIYDTSTGIKRSVSALLQDGLFGALFAVLVIFLFLLTVRTTLVTAVSIPLSILTAIIILNLRGFTLNIMTISAIAVAVGRVVDDAIVVLENVYRHVQEGESRVEATVNGVREVARAIIGSTLTTVAVFLPIGFIGGILGQFFEPFALTVTFALVASLVVALTVVPALGSLFITKKKHGGGETRIQRLYTPILTWGLAHRAITVVVAGALFFASVSLVFVVPKGFFPAGSEPLATINVSLPPGTSLDRTTSAVARLETSVLMRQVGLQNWETIVGYDNAGAQRGGSGSASNTATVFAVYQTDTDMTVALNRLRADLKPYESGRLVTTVEGVQNGPPSSVDLLVTSGNGSGITAATRELFAKVRTVPGLVNAQSNLQSRKPQVEIAIDPQQALRHGLTPATAAIAIRSILTGQTVTTVRLAGGRETSSVFVQVDPTAANTVQKIRTLRIGTPPAPIGSIARITNGLGPVAIPRQNQETVGEVTALVNNASDASQVTTQVQKAIAPVVSKWKARNVTIEQAGIGKEITDGFINMGIAMLVAMGLVYLVMVFLFRSLLVPFVILFSLPLAVIGALVALAITQRTLDMSAMIGALMLIGVVVTNAVVLLDLVQQKLDTGMDLHSALLAGGRTRVRPILMTAIATILALMPLAVVGSGGGIIAANLATVVIGGLLTSTLLTLVVVPVVYSLFISLRGRVVSGGHGGAVAVERSQVREKALALPSK